LCLIGRVVADDKPTSLSDARTAVESNLRTSEGKAYDEKLGKEFLEKQLATMRHCKQSAGNDLESFWVLLKLDKDGAVKEVLLHPTTKMGTCARETLLKSLYEIKSLNLILPNFGSLLLYSISGRNHSQRNIRPVIDSGQMPLRR